MLVEQTLTNTADEPRTVAPWGITVVRANGVAVVPNPRYRPQLHGSERRPLHVNEPPPEPGVVKEEVALPDGRYLIYYTFEDDDA